MLKEKEVIMDSSAIIRLGNEGLTKTTGTLVIPVAIHNELLSQNRSIPPRIRVITTNMGPSLADFKKEDSRLYTWASTGGGYVFQIVAMKGYFKASCGKHESNFQLSIVGLDRAFSLCSQIVKTADFAVLTASLINPRFKFRSFDYCLLKSIGNLRLALQISV